MNIEAFDNLIDLPPFNIPAQFFRAENPRALIIFLPAMGTVANYYQSFAETWFHAGYSVMLAELPGTGASMPRPSRTADYGYHDLLEQYLPAIIRAARNLQQESPLIIMGHSLGAQIGTIAVAQGKPGIDSLVTIAGGHIHYRNWGGAEAGKVLFAAGLFSSLTYLLGHLPGQYFGFGGPQAPTLIRDWSRIIYTGSFSHVADGLSNHAPTPVLNIGFENDSFSPRKSVEALAGFLGGEVKIMPVNWPGKPHSSWARNSRDLIAFIDRWLRGKDIVR